MMVLFVNTRGHFRLGETGLARLFTEVDHSHMSFLLAEPFALAVFVGQIDHVLSRLGCSSQIVEPVALILVA